MPSGRPLVLLVGALAQALGWVATEAVSGGRAGPPAPPPRGGRAGAIARAALSPDGARMAVITRSRVFSDNRLWVVELSTGEVRLWRDHVSMCMPAWRAGRRQVAVNAVRRRTCRVLLVGPPGAAAAEVPGGPDWQQNPAWSRAGDLMAYEAYPAGAIGAQIWAFDPRARNHWPIERRVRISHGTLWWSPAAPEIAYVRLPPVSPQVGELVVTGARAPSPRVLLRRHEITRLAWRADGRLLAVGVCEPSHAWCIEVVDLTGARPTTRIDLPPGVSLASSRIDWSPSRAEIAFDSDPGSRTAGHLWRAQDVGRGRWALARVSSGGEPRRLIGWADAGNVWCHDGRVLLLINARSGAVVRRLPRVWREPGRRGRRPGGAGPNASAALLRSPSCRSGGCRAQCGRGRHGKYGGNQGDRLCISRSSTMVRRCSP
jgi:hypothetical protein